MVVAGPGWEPGTPRKNVFGEGKEQADTGLMLSCFLSCVKYPRDEELKEPSGGFTSKCVVLAEQSQLCHWFFTERDLADSQAPAKGNKCGSGSALQDAALRQFEWEREPGIGPGGTGTACQTGGFGERGDVTARWLEASWQGANQPGSCTVLGKADTTRLCPPRGWRCEQSRAAWGAAGHHHPLSPLHPLIIIQLKKKSCSTIFHF